MNVFDLVAKLTLDSSEYDEGLEQSEEKGSKFGEKLKSGLATGAKAAVAGVTALTTATIAGATAVVNATNDVAAYGDQIDKQSQKLGMSATAYQEWDAILQHSGSSISALTPAMKTLQAEVAKGGEAFEALGMSQEEVASMSNEELFAATIAGLQGMGDETERNALASDLLGRSYMELQPLLNTSVEDTEAMRQAVHDLGGVMSEDAVKDAAAYQDAMQDMNTSLDGVKRSVITSFMPGITDAMNGIAKLFSGDTEGGITQITNGLKTLITNISQKAPEVATAAGQLISALLTTLVEALPEMVTSGIDIVISFVEGLISGDSISKTISAIVTLFFTITTYLIEHLPDIIALGIELVQSLAQGLIENLPAVISGITDVLMAIMDFLMGDGLIELIQAGIQLVFGLAEGLIDNLPAIIQAAIELIIGLTTGLIEHIPDIITAAIELIGGLITGLIQAIPDIIAALPQIFEAIINAFAETDWLAIGTNIIDGIVDGIGGAVSRLWEAAVNAAKAALSKIKNVLGISSPSKVFRDQVGEMIPEGMAIGIEANTDAVEDAMQDLADITTDPFANMGNVISLDEGQDVGSVRGGVVINVYPREGQDEESIAEYVMEKLNLEYQREERALA